MTQKGLILFAHGARDPRWAAPFQRLQKSIKESAPDQVVGLAFLEFMNPSLTWLAEQMINDGCAELVVTPIFLGQGGHVLRDLPEMVAQLCARFPAVEIRIADAVGENAMVLHAIRDYCLSTVQLP